MGVCVCMYNINVVIEEGRSNAYDKVENVNKVERTQVMIVIITT